MRCVALPSPSLPGGLCADLRVARATTGNRCLEFVSHDRRFIPYFRASVVLTKGPTIRCWARFIHPLRILSRVLQAMTSLLPQLQNTGKKKAMSISQPVRLWVSTFH